MVEYSIIINDVYNRRKIDLKVAGAKTVGEVKDLLIPELGDVQRSAMRLIFSGKNSPLNLAIHSPRCSGKRDLTTA